MYRRRDAYPWREWSWVVAERLEGIFGRTTITQQCPATNKECSICSLMSMRMRIVNDCFSSQLWIVQLVVDHHTITVNVGQIQGAKIQVEVPIHHLIINAEEMFVCDIGWRRIA
jgi:hypothetical protein